MGGAQNSRTLGIVWAALGLAVATTIIQSHGIPFWIAQAGWIGVVWSVGAEVLAYQFVSQGDTSRAGGWLNMAAGVVTALVVVGGPLMEVVEPAVEEVHTESQQADRLEERLERLRADIQEAEADKEFYQERAAETQHYSDGRSERFQRRADEAQATKRELRQKQRAVSRKLSGLDTSMGWAELLVIALHAGILLSAWVASIATARRLYHYASATAGSGAAVPEPQEQPEPAAATEPDRQAQTGDTVRNRRRLDLARRLHNYIADNGDANQVAIAREIEAMTEGEVKATSVRPSLSRALNEEKNPTAPDRTFDLIERFLERNGA